MTEDCLMSHQRVWALARNEDMQVARIKGRANADIIG